MQGIQDSAKALTAGGTGATDPARQTELVRDAYNKRNSGKAPEGFLFTNGKGLWSSNSGGACNAGPAITDGMVFWGTGTSNGTGPLKVFAFGL
jgi:hypothetical protein